MGAAPTSNAPRSPLGEFDLEVEDDMAVGEHLVRAVATLVDVLHQQVVSWGLDPCARTGGHHRTLSQFC
jgi:hypothetical protein